MVRYTFHTLAESVALALGLTLALTVLALLAGA